MRVEFMDDTTRSIIRNVKGPGTSASLYIFLKMGRGMRRCGVQEVRCSGGAVLRGRVLRVGVRDVWLISLLGGSERE